MRERRTTRCAMCRKAITQPLFTDHTYRYCDACLEESPEQIRGRIRSVHNDRREKAHAH